MGRRNFFTQGEGYEKGWGGTKGTPGRGLSGTGGCAAFPAGSRAPIDGCLCKLAASRSDSATQPSLAREPARKPRNAALILSVPSPAGGW